MNSNSLIAQRVAQRPPELRRRNRRVATIIVVVVTLMTLACAAYINWYGGLNKGPMKPLRSSSY